MVQMNQTTCESNLFPQTDLYKYLGYFQCPINSSALFSPYLAEILLFVQLFPKLLGKMTNSGDPDKTAPSGPSDLGLHCLHMLFCQKHWCTKHLL